jgi:sarcosine oxidase, subunit beta
MAAKRAAGAGIEMISAERVGELEPAISARVVAASWCSDDGYANPGLTSVYYRALLGQAGVEIVERAPVVGIDRDGGEFHLVTEGRIVRARRILLACGGWLRSAGAMLDLDLPIRARINTVSVTERGPKLIRGIVGHATGLLTLKQSENGTLLIGGGWQGQGSPETGRGRVDPDTLLPNLQFARYTLPAIGNLRIVRAWTGYEANVPDFFPLAGAIPGIEGAFVLGCVRGGYTIGPYIGALMGDLILGREPEMPLFDPSRVLGASAPAATTEHRSDHENRSQPA